jgi:AAA+ superfamily predicted ATPase
MSTEGAGYWIVLSTIITMITPIFIRYFEQLVNKLMDKFSTGFSLQRKWTSSVQLVCNTTITNFASRSNVNGAYKSVMFHLMNRVNTPASLKHIRQQPIMTDDDEKEDFLNRSFDFIATAHNKPILLDENTWTYVIPTHENIQYKEAVTANDVITLVSNHVSATEILNLISSFQVKYQDYIKRYNREGKLKYIKLCTFSKDVIQVQPHHHMMRVKDHIQDQQPQVHGKRSAVWDVAEFCSSKSFSNVFFTNKDRIVRQIEHFSTGEEFYKHRGIPWTLNILLYGVPGCGKTSFIKALSNKLNRHILDISLSAIKTTEDFSAAFSTELFKDHFIPIDKRIIVLEDIDCTGSDVLEDRSKRSSPAVLEEGQMNLSCFLNTLDGIQEQHGRILIATTNCIDTLDPAVLRRFNVKVHFMHLTRELTQSIVNNYYDDEVPLPETWEPNNLTGAALTRLCMQFQEEPLLCIQELLK